MALMIVVFDFLEELFISLTAGSQSRDWHAGHGSEGLGSVTVGKVRVTNVQLGECFLKGDFVL
jgi:hypothetical protein